MQKFMLLVREDLSAMRGLTPEQRFGGSPDMNSWVNELIASGKYIMGQPFGIEGYYVSKNGAESDGDFLRSKQGLSGFDLIFAEDLQEALEVAKSCPMVKIGMAIREVRPFQEFL